MDLGIPGLEGAEAVGQGGFATVYKARQPAFARTVAVKVLADAHFDEDSRLRFERELHALGRLSEHPGIVTVHGTGFTTDGRPYLTMAFVEEGTLDDRLRTGGPVPWADAVRILVRLCGALETAHRSGIIHRDIKPANVLLARYGAQLSDFGIARIAGAHETQSGVVTASIAYAAPEVLDGERPTQLADVYSLGSTAYSMLLGKPPFERASHETFIPLMLRIQTEAPPDLRQYGVPDDLAALLEQTLAKAPADRPRSALEFGRRLQDVMRSHGQGVPELILAPDVVADVDASLAANATSPVGSAHGGGPPVGGDDSGRPGDRRRLVAGLAVAGTVVAVLAGAGLLLRDTGDTAGPDSTVVPPTIDEPVTAPPTVVTSPETVAPETVVTSPETVAPETVATVPDTEVPPETTLAPISAEPVCGAGEGLLPGAGEPVRVILDTGVGLGIDDLGALAVLHALADDGEADILATMVSAGGDPAAGPTVDAINTYYGRADLPVGVVSGPAPTGESAYTSEIAAGFPNDLVDAPAAVDVYREVLAAQPDGSVTIVSGGFLTNLAALLASPPDEVSDLTGAELIATKVNRWFAMGGAYPDSTDVLSGPEFNFARDANAALRATTDWPTPAVFSGFEVGDQILTGAVLQTETEPNNPVREGYRLGGATENMESFDLTAVLAAVRGTADGAFEVCTGRNVVGSDGSTTWEHRAGGSQGYLRLVAPSQEIADTIDELLVRSPAS